MRTKINGLLFSRSAILLTALTSVIGNFSCSEKSTPDPVPPTPPVVVVTATSDVDFWLTKGDQSALLQKQTETLSFGTTAGGSTFIDVDSTQKFQTIDGFGYTLTGGSATLINQLDATQKVNLLQELFSRTGTGIGVSYLRISIGASDLSANDFTYDDIPSGQGDTTLAQFNLGPDKTDLVPLLKQIIAINPSIKIIATPWTAPAWMKSNKSFVSGSLVPGIYPVYAAYFVKYLQAMKAEGINIDAITPQNEPENGGNNPSMLMTAQDQSEFVRNFLAPALTSAGISAKIILFDHNCDHPNYPLAELSDPGTRAVVNGTAFHLYAGDISAMGIVHDAFPDKQVYFTEQFTASTGDFGGDLKWHLKNVIIGSMRNYSRIALEWNLANDANFGPHTNGGCTTCKGALTIGNGIARNVGYYIVAHASKFVPAGSVRIASNNVGDVQDVAFLTPEGKKVLLAENDGASAATFNLRYKGKWVACTLPAGCVGTFTW